MYVSEYTRKQNGVYLNPSSLWLVLDENHKPTVQNLTLRFGYMVHPTDIWYRPAWIKLRNEVPMNLHITNGLNFMQLRFL
jgi:hypothetical protein